LFSVVSTLRERELKLLREFGMTPSSRTRVQVAREEGMEDLWAILSGPRVRRNTQPESTATQAEPVQ
jgi:phage terminase small subunit